MFTFRISGKPTDSNCFGTVGGLAKKFHNFIGRGVFVQRVP
jgi:hypothetical protein